MALTDLKPSASNMIIGVQETRWTGNIDTLVPTTAWGAVHLVTANDPEDAALGRHGTTLVVTGALACSPMSVTRSSPRLLSVHIRPTISGHPRLHVLVGYAPATSATDRADDNYHHWLSALDQTITTAQSAEPWVPTFVLADFNARIGMIHLGHRSRDQPIPRRVCTGPTKRAGPPGTRNCN